MAGCELLQSCVAFKGRCQILHFLHAKGYVADFSRQSNAECKNDDDNMRWIWQSDADWKSSQPAVVRQYGTCSAQVLANDAVPHD